MTISVRQRPRRRCSAVVEHRLADQLDLDLTVDARRGPHQDMISVIVGRGSGVRRDDVFALSRPHRQRVAHDDPTARRVPRRRHDVRARLIGARRRDVDTERTKPEIPRLAVEQRPEHAGRVEARHAQPRDAPVGRDQRTRMTVGEEPKVLDRRKRRWHRRTLLAAGCGVGHGLISFLSHAHTMSCGWCVDRGERFVMLSRDSLAALMPSSVTSTRLSRPDASSDVGDAEAPSVHPESAVRHGVRASRAASDAVQLAVKVLPARGLAAEVLAWPTTTR